MKFFWSVVNGNRLFLSFAWRNTSSRVEAVAPFLCQPFVSFQPVVISRVHDGVARLLHADPAKSVPVAQPAVPEHRPDQWSDKPKWNGNIESNLADPCWLIAGMLK